MTQPLRFLKALADPTRLRLVGMLARYELGVNEIVRLLEMGQSRVSRHLAILARSGLLEPRREGLWVYYRGIPGGAPAPLLAALDALVQADPEAREQAEEDLARAAASVEERTARTRQFFDARAGDWDRLSREALGKLDLGAAVGSLLTGLPKPPALAVDIGCGTGALLEPLAARVGRAIGVDSSPRMLERARRRFEGREGVELRLGEAEHLPLGDGEAHLAVMSMTLHHLADPERGLREVARVTRRGGHFILAELSRHAREELRDVHGDRWLGFDREDLVAMAARSGLMLEEEESFELPKGLELRTYLFRNGGKRDGQRRAVRGSRPEAG